MAGDAFEPETSLKETVAQIPKKVMATISSKEEAAMRAVGMPFLTP